MNIKQMVSGFLGVMTMTALLAGASMANTPIANVIVSAPTTTDFTFTGGVGGSFAQSAAGGLAVFSNGPTGGAPASSFFVFGPTKETGPEVSAGGSTSALFGGSTFSLTTGSGGTGTVLLTGAFGTANLQTNTGSAGSVQNFNLNNVSYTGGTYLSQFLALNGGTTAVGNFSVSLSAISPNLVSTPPSGGGLPAFSAQGSVATFDATSVPEPTSVAAFAFTGLGLAGLMLRTRKNRVSNITA